MIWRIRIKIPVSPPINLERIIENISMADILEGITSFNTTKDGLTLEMYEKVGIDIVDGAEYVVIESSARDITPEIESAIDFIGKVFRRANHTLGGQRVIEYSARLRCKLKVDFVKFLNMKIGKRIMDILREAYGNIWVDPENTSLDFIMNKLVVKISEATVTIERIDISKILRRISRLIPSRYMFAYLDKIVKLSKLLYVYYDVEVKASSIDAVEDVMNRFINKTFVEVEDLEKEVMERLSKLGLPEPMIRLIRRELEFL